LTADVVIDVRVVPRASKTAFAGERNGAFLVRLAAPPIDNAANDALIEFLADTLDVPRRALRIVSGQRSRAKRIAIAGVTLADVRARLSLG
jgi:uncharacterized protein (TIGR00251 family)